MKLFVAVTDRNWFEFLRARGPAEANFWQPGGGQALRAIDPGELVVLAACRGQGPVGCTAPR